MNRSERNMQRPGWSMFQANYSLDVMVERYREIVSESGGERERA